MAPIDETIKKIIDYCKHKPLDMNILTDLKFPNAHSFHTFINLLQVVKSFDNSYVCLATRRNSYILKLKDKTTLETIMQNKHIYTDVTNNLFAYTNEWTVDVNGHTLKVILNSNRDKLHGFFITDDTNKLLVTMDNKSGIFISNEIASVINDFNFTKRDDSYWSIVGKDCDIPESLKPTITQYQILLNLVN